MLTLTFGAWRKVFTLTKSTEDDFAAAIKLLLGIADAGLRFKEILCEYVLLEYSPLSHLQDLSCSNLDRYSAVRPSDSPYPMQVRCDKAHLQLSCSLGDGFHSARRADALAPACSGKPETPQCYRWLVGPALAVRQLWCESYCRASAKGCCASLHCRRGARTSNGRTGAVSSRITRASDAIRGLRASPRRLRISGGGNSRPAGVDRIS